MKKELFLILAFLCSGLPSMLSQNVGVGIVSPLSKLHIKGSANNSQLIIDAHSTQSNTSPLFKLRNSMGNDLMWIHADDSSNVFIGLRAGRFNNAAALGLYNTFIGSHTGYSNTTGDFNTANGNHALFSNTTGAYNTANGSGALFSNTTGINNTANGSYSLSTNTTGGDNTTNGYGSLFSNTSGSFNTANGSSALFSNTEGDYNTAYGMNAMHSNIRLSGGTAIGYNAMRFANNTTQPDINYNVAVGYEALSGSPDASANTGNLNTAVGYRVLNINTTGSANTAVGTEALYANTTGNNNSANGYGSLTSNITGNHNSAHGSYTLNNNATGNRNTAIGYGTLYSTFTGNDNTALGYGADIANDDISNATVIGSNAYAAASNSVILGSINGINGATASANVGIGTTTPNAKLHISGTLKVADGTQGAGKILTSDATGLASWQPPPPVSPTYYPSVSICCQSWMTKNLDVSTYRNGDPIPKVTSNAAWAALTTGAYCYYNNDSTTYAGTYGKMYNWYAVNDPRGLAPQGWHIPTDFEWATLGNCLGGNLVAGGPMKEIGTTHWNSPNAMATNLSGFTGLPGGYRFDNGSFTYIGNNGGWWSSTEYALSTAYLYDLSYGFEYLSRSGTDKRLGLSVRCVRD